MTHIKIHDQLVHRDDIRHVDISSLESQRLVSVTTVDGCIHLVSGQPALDLVMDLRPSAVEGKRFTFTKHAWAFHNLVAHPALQILSWLGMTELGFKIHDASVPRPR